jgi:FMN-dependent NADH-azoreductase
MTERAQKVMDAFYKDWSDEYPNDKIVVINVLREVADRLCTDWAELQHPADVLNEIADEVENL